MICLALGLVAIIGLSFLSNLTEVYYSSDFTDSLWQPYFLMENFLFGPILSELIFRELFMKLFQARQSMYYILGSSLVNVLLYLVFFSYYDYSALLFLFLSGLVFAGLRWYSNDIKLPIALHILLNLGANFL
jgi:membrane protease YdiL (CAAX protease family)